MLHLCQTVRHGLNMIIKAGKRGTKANTEICLPGGGGQGGSYIHVKADFFKPNISPTDKPPKQVIGEVV